MTQVEKKISLDNILKVTGEGFALVTANIAVIDLVIKGLSVNAADAQKILEAKRRHVMGVLGRKHAANFQTKNFNLFSAANISNKTYQNEDFVAREVIRFECPMKNVGKMVQAVIDTGTNPAYSVKLRPSEKEESIGRMQALNRAVIHAKRKAAQVLKALGCEIKEIGKVKILDVALNNSADNARIYDDGSLERSASVNLPGSGEQVQQITAKVSLSILFSQ